MHDSYFYNYLLSYFTINQPVKLTQIYHVLRGKKTPSMYYITEKNQWHHGFSLEKRIERTDINNFAQIALRKNLINKKNEALFLTYQGKEYLNQYFEKHYYPKMIKSFENIELYLDFWEQVLLLTQVFSEYSYKNNQYNVVIKNPYHQEKIRQLFRQAKGSLMLSQWIDEQLFVFNHLETKKADILANLLTGHKKNGRTRKQIAEHLGMSAYEFNFYLRDMIQEIIEIVRENELTIMASVLKQTEEENFFSMSKSTYESYKMFKKGKVIPEIASDREIKENTVKEHLLEIAFIIKRFPINKFVPENIHSYLTKEFIENENYIYKDIPAEKEIEFYHYRLVEIERMRRT